MSTKRRDEGRAYMRDESESFGKCVGWMSSTSRTTWVGSIAAMGWNENETETEI